MELRTLRAFVEVVRQGGFSQAAKVVFATQSTISKAVKHLEDELGVTLLDRVGHRSTLTAAGEIVYRRALSMLAERDDLVAELDELRGLKRGVLRLGLPPLGSSTLFAPLFATYRSRYPGIEIRLAEHGSKRLEELLLAGEMDFAASLLPVSDVFEAEPVRSEPLVALLPPGHPAQDARSVRLQDLAASPFILFESGFALNAIILDACDRQGVVPDIIARSAQIDFIVALVAAGLGVGFLPRMIAEQRAHAAVTRVLLDEPGTDWSMAVIWRRGAYLSDAARAWLQLTREIYGPRG
ncbi:LysR family transcriptional regulator [Aquabacter sp. L1I39]|uniref:LysR family transcriptional regulator n=1 Tax=Aquabacter sp. L1I39 TaxID=2820278 RepID=UPI001ADB4217|nr:LysR family transcriptional regulator [Aquabacter sp. L1I39]QTL02447.1 LysR family transcriptional regulator [Aquabacter sp. L1I39]